MLNLSASVGHKGANRPSDVRRVQRALNTAAEVFALDVLDVGPVDGKCGDGTIGALSAFQRYVCHAYRPDGRADPGGRTERTLSASQSFGKVLWRYPLARKATAAFTGPGGGMRQFRWRRSGGKRAHAGVDLYAPVGTDVVAVDHGRVLRSYPFYLGTHAVEVEHKAPDGTPYVVRYGEVSRIAVKAGDTVERGQRIADVGRLTGLSFSMLHIELYLGTAKGRLSQNGAKDRVHGRPFKRRSDIADPTGLLMRAPLPS